MHNELETQHQNCSNSYLEAGENHHDSKNYEKAFQCFEKAVKSHPKHPTPYYMLGIMHELGQYVDKDLNKAKQYYEKSTENLMEMSEDNIKNHHTKSPNQVPYTQPTEEPTSPATGEGGRGNIEVQSPNQISTNSSFGLFSKNIKENTPSRVLSEQDENTCGCVIQ